MGRYEDSLAIPETSGSIDVLPVYAGQRAGLTRETQPAGDLVAVFADETIAAIERTNGVINQ